MSNNPLKAIIKLSQTDFDNLKNEGSIIKNGQTVYYSPSDTIYMVEDEISEKIDEKLDKNQGISNAGKVMIVDEYGNVMPETLADGGTTVTVDGEVQSIWDADTKADKTELPTKTSDLTNDSGFITLSAVPTATSELTNDGDGIQVSGAIDPYAKVSQIPTNNNQLTNGADYATNSEVNSAVNTKTAVNVNNQLQSTLSFDSDPQSQITTLSSSVTTLKDMSFDLIIQTQTEFEEFYTSLDNNSCTAHSVLLKGDGGTLKFTRSDGKGLYLQDSVYRLEGANNAIIQTTNFSINTQTNKGAIWYNALPTDISKYSIKDITLIATATTNIEGFYNCVNLENCIANVSNSTSGLIGAAGFRNCENLVNCTSTVDGTNTAYGFRECNYLINCRATTTVALSAYCYYNCDNLANYSSSTDSSFAGFDIVGCTNVANKLNPDYDSGWFDFSAATTYTFTHNLNTTEFYTLIDIKHTSPNLYTQNTMINSDGTSNSYSGGINETYRTATQIWLRGAKDYAIQFSSSANDGGTADDQSLPTGQARVRLFRIV